MMTTAATIHQIIVWYDESPILPPAPIGGSGGRVIILEGASHPIVLRIDGT